MRIQRAMTTLALLAVPLAPAAGSIPYRADPAIDANAQLAEMLALYADLCIADFPSDAAVSQRIARLQPAPITGSALQDIFHGDPGLAWAYRGKTSMFVIGLEAAPFHACSVRTMTAAGFADMTTYRALADEYENKLAGFQRFKPIDMQIGNVRTVGMGESMVHADGNADALMVFVVTPADAKVRQAGYSGIEVRFVHQMASPQPR